MKNKFMKSSWNTGWSKKYEYEREEDEAKIPNSSAGLDFNFLHPQNSDRVFGIENCNVAQRMAMKRIDFVMRIYYIYGR